MRVVSSCSNFMGMPFCSNLSWAWHTDQNFLGVCFYTCSHRHAILINLSARAIQDMPSMRHCGSHFLDAISNRQTIAQAKLTSAQSQRIAQPRAGEQKKRSHKIEKKKQLAIWRHAPCSLPSWSEAGAPPANSPYKFCS